MRSSFCLFVFLFFIFYFFFKRMLRISYTMLNVKEVW